MFRKKSIFGALMTLLVVVVLVTGGFALFRVGFAQGYSTGITAEGDGSAIAFPDGFQRGFGPNIGYPMGVFVFGRLIGMFFFVGLLIMLIGGIKRMFWYRHWKTAGGPGSEVWKDWHYHPGAYKWGPPPWAKDENISNKSDEPDETSGPAE